MTRKVEVPAAGRAWKKPIPKPVVSARRGEVTSSEHAPTLWQRRALALAERLPRLTLSAPVLAFAERKRRTVWHVAFSGGADSLAALLLTWAHWPEQRGKIIALHFNHRLRGAASGRDETFCRGVCSNLGVKLVVGQWRNAPRNPSEGEARVARLEFFSRHSRLLWLGHHQDDVAETMLMRLARGSGAGGLAAPRPVQKLPQDRWNVRPLLTLQKTRIVAALERAAIPWQTDATNATRKYFRNRVRNTVVRAWKKSSQGDAIAGAALARELLEEDDEALNLLAAAKIFFTGKRLNVRVLREQPRAIVRRAVYRWLGMQRPVALLSRPAFAALLSAVERGADTRQSLDADRFAVICRGFLSVSKSRRGAF